MEGLMSFAEIGERIGTSEQEARQIYQGAVKKLRAYLRRHPSVADELWWFLEKPSLVPRVQSASMGRCSIHVLPDDILIDFQPTDEVYIASPENGQEAA